MSKIFTTRTANKVTKQRALTLAKSMSTNDEASDYAVIKPTIINLEQKYGHRVRKIGSKGVEITPISEIRPLNDRIKVSPVSRKQNVKQRKKNRFGMLKESLMKYAKK